MSLNTKNITIDADRATTIVAPNNAVLQPISFVRGNEYIVLANVYSNASSTELVPLSIYDNFELIIGRTYNPSATPVTLITDQSKFNNVTDYPQANVASGILSMRVNVGSNALTTDIGNNTSQSYTMEVILTNNVGGKVMLLDTTATIINCIQI